MKQFDFKKDVMLVTETNKQYLSSRKRSFVSIVLFSTTDARYDCPTCAELERQFIQIHDSLYSMKESEDMRVVFAIARFENAYSFFDESKVEWVPYAHINTPPLPGIKGKTVGYPQTQLLTSSDLLHWVNRMLKVEIKVPLPAEQTKDILIYCVIIVSVFSLLYLPGRGLVETLKMRTSYTRLCLAIVFLCLSCLPYILINKPSLYTTREGKRGGLIYSFFSQGENKLGLEGAIVSFWLLLIFVACMGFIYWLPACSNVFMSSLAMALCSSLFIVAILQVHSAVEYSLPFTKGILDYSKEAIFGKQRCIFCQQYWNYLQRTAIKKEAAYKDYFASLRALWKQCFQ
ncbi:hypothetical protein WA556_001001 [Blastocystis sp. ATCC 50177/Nand II]